MLQSDLSQRRIPVRAQTAAFKYVMWKRPEPLLAGVQGILKERSK